jgi:hypothetical protein
MAMQIRCRCGANLVVDGATPTIVCAACQATLAVPQPERELALSETIPAFQATPPPKAAVRRRAWWPLALVMTAVFGAAGVLLYFALSKDTTSSRAVAKPVTIVDGASAAPAAATSPEELVVFARNALARADEAALATLLAPNAFVHGLDAGDVAVTGPTAAGMLAKRGPLAITSTWSKITRDKDVAWVADELDAGGQKLMTSQLAFRDGTTWRIAAWQVAMLVGNKRAFDLASAGQLPPPKPLDDQHDDDHQVHDAMRAAFLSREAFVEAFSDRADAIDLGSAPGERVIGGEKVKRTFMAIPATLALHDGVAAGRVSDRVGWGAANVDYTIQGKGTQTFRVLAVLVRERAGWRIVLAQWSNAGPLP